MISVRWRAAVSLALTAIVLACGNTPVGLTDGDGDPDPGNPPLPPPPPPPAPPPQQLVSVTITGGGAGSGRVTSTDPAHIIDCGIAAGVATPPIKCDVLIERSNSELILRPTPDPGSAFVSWTCTRDQVFGDCTPCPAIGDCKITWTVGVVPLRFRITATFGVLSPVNQLPAVTIAAPAPDAKFAVHATVAFTGSATDPEDGSLLVHWSLPQPPYTTLAQLATGTTFTIDSAQVGPLELAAWVQDNNGGRDSTRRRVFVVFGGEIAFDIGETELRRSDGTVMTKLPDGGKPAWSPNGQQIAFVKFDGKDTEIYIMNTDGTGVPVQVTNNTADDDTPAWSPDGLKLAYDSDSLGQREIFFKELATGQVTRVTTHPADDAEPAWCGTDILFQSDRDNDSEIYRQGTLLNVAPKQLTINSVEDLDPHWSVDCSQIVFSREEANGNLDIYLLNANGTGVATNLTNHPANDRQPELSPDKLLVIFKSDRAGTEDLWFIRTTAPALPRLWKSTTNAGHPRWKP
jgi:hypothetical protein